MSQLKQLPEETFQQTFEKRCFYYTTIRSSEAVPERNGKLMNKWMSVEVRLDQSRYSEIALRKQEKHGPRLRIGVSFAMMEAQIILAAIAQQYQLRMVPGHPVVPQALVSLRPNMDYA